MKKSWCFLLVGLAVLSILSSSCIASEEERILSAAKKHVLALGPYSNTIKFYNNSFVKKLSSNPNRYMAVLYYRCMVNEWGDIEDWYNVYLVDQLPNGEYRFDGWEDRYMGLDLPPDLKKLFEEYVRIFTADNVERFKDLYSPTVSISAERYYEEIDKEQRLYLWEKMRNNRSFKDCVLVNVAPYMYYKNEYMLTICFILEDEYGPYFLRGCVDLTVKEGDKGFQIEGELFKDSSVDILGKWMKNILYISYY